MNKIIKKGLDPRHTTNSLIELINKGHLNKDDLIMACLKFMSEADVKEMLEANDYTLDGIADDQGATAPISPTTQRVIIMNKAIANAWAQDKKNRKSKKVSK